MSDYWRPVFHYLRVKGYAVADAEDVTQEFFTSLWSGSLGLRPDPARGRFRDYLRVVVSRFAYDRVVRPKAQERFERGLPQLSALMRDEDRAFEPVAGDTPEAAFDRQWKVDIRSAVRRNLEAYSRGTGDPDDPVRHEIFAAYHFAKQDSDRPRQEDLAERFRKGRGFVQNALKVMTSRYEHLLRQEVRDQVGSEDEVEAELRGLC